MLVVKLGEDMYARWSGALGCPASDIVWRARAVELWGATRVARADELSATNPPAVIVRGNRAGENESTISLDRIKLRFLHPEWRQHTVTVGRRGFARSVADSDFG